jgi:hypothetical protein
VTIDALKNYMAFSAQIFMKLLVALHGNFCRAFNLYRLMNIDIMGKTGKVYPITYREGTGVEV